ncbi:MAG: DUF6470 family protein [Syntrophomonas sp.]
MDLKISQQYGRIGLNIQKPQVKLNITLPKENVSCKISKVIISSPDPKLYLDQTQCWEDMGYRTPEAFGGYMASNGQSKVMAGIARRAQEGDTLAAIDKGNTVQSVIASRIRSESTCEYTIAYIPKHPPQVEPEVENIEVNVEAGGASASVQLGSVDYNAPWAKVDMYLLQKPSIDVKWVGSHYDTIT